MFGTLSILLHATVLENCSETPRLKPFITSCSKLKCPLFVRLESFLIGKPWSSSQSRKEKLVYENLVPVWAILVSVLFVELFYFFKNFLNLSRYWTTFKHNQTENRLIYCRSRDMIPDHRASIFTKNIVMSMTGLFPCVLSC